MQYDIFHDECHIRGGHFLTLKAAAVTLWKTQRLPFEIVYQVLNGN